jgi:polar amino acid transport system substrate-binding protein
MERQRRIKLIFFIAIGIGVLITCVIAGCATTTDSRVAEHALPQVTEPAPPPLLVGITPNNPPMIFKLQGRITGLETDLAKRLGAELNRPVEFVELPWEQQIDALLYGRIDIIMSGMTITEARKVRINFTIPYLKSGLVAAVRASDESKYKTVENIIGSHDSVGVMEGTTSEAFVRKNMPKSQRILVLKKLSDAALELKDRRIDIFIYDAPAIVWLVSENEATLRGVWKPLNEEYLGWGVRRDDKEFLAHVDAILTRWKSDGTLKEVILKWLPYWKNFDF